MPGWTIYLLYLIPLFGVISFIIGIKELRKSSRRIKEWIKVTGNITALKEVAGPISLNSNTNSTGVSFQSVYKFQIAEKEYTGTGSTVSSPAAYNVGDTVTILVNPDNPNESDIYDSSFIYMPFIPLILGIIFLTAGSIAVYYFIIAK